MSNRPVIYTDENNKSVPEIKGEPYIFPFTVDRSTVVQAVAIKTGYDPSVLTAQSYIFLDQVLEQTRPPDYPLDWGLTPGDYNMDPNVVNQEPYNEEIKNALNSIPSISLIMEKEHLFGEDGIYSNPWGSGVEWERPGSAELIRPGGSEGFQIN